MTRLALVLALALAGSPETGPRFRALDLVLDADVAVAAWQVEIVAVGGEARVVGVEGGEAPFTAPPTYDPAALQLSRLVLLAFDIHAALPPGRHRVATIHVREAGATRYALRLVAAGDAAGARVSVTPSLEPRSTP